MADDFGMGYALGADSGNRNNNDAVYSDFCEVLMDHGCTGTDLYLDLAKAWLEDKDAVPDKARVYYECIVE